MLLPADQYHLIAPDEYSFSLSICPVRATMALERPVTQRLFLDYVPDGKTPCNVRDFYPHFCTDISTLDDDDEPRSILAMPSP